MKTVTKEFDSIKAEINSIALDIVSGKMSLEEAKPRERAVAQRIRQIDHEFGEDSARLRAQLRAQLGL